MNINDVMGDELVETIPVSHVLKYPIAGLLATEEDTEDDLAQKIMYLESLRVWAKDLIGQAEESIRVQLEERRISLLVGDMKYWSGPVESAPKCNGQRKACEVLMNRLGGDWDAFCDHLGSGAVKYGAARKTLGDEEYGKLWSTETKDKLIKDDAVKVDRRLQKANMRFVK